MNKSKKYGCPLLSNTRSRFFALRPYSNVIKHVFSGPRELVALFWVPPPI